MHMCAAVLAHFKRKISRHPTDAAVAAEIDF